MKIKSLILLIGFTSLTEATNCLINGVERIYSPPLPDNLADNCNQPMQWNYAKAQCYRNNPNTIPAYLDKGCTAYAGCYGNTKLGLASKDEYCSGIASTKAALSKVIESTPVLTTKLTTTTSLPPTKVTTAASAPSTTTATPKSTNLSPINCVINGVERIYTPPLPANLPDRCDQPMQWNYAKAQCYNLNPCTAPLWLDKGCNAYAACYGNSKLGNEAKDAYCSGIKDTNLSLSIVDRTCMDNLIASRASKTNCIVGGVERIYTPALPDNLQDNCYNPMQWNYAKAQCYRKNPNTALYWLERACTFYANCFGDSPLNDQAKDAFCLADKNTMDELSVIDTTSLASHCGINGTERVYTPPLPDNLPDRCNMTMQWNYAKAQCYRNNPNTDLFWLDKGCSLYASCYGDRNLNNAGKDFYCSGLKDTRIALSITPNCAESYRGDDWQNYYYHCVLFTYSYNNPDFTFVQKRYSYAAQLVSNVNLNVFGDYIKERALAYNVFCSLKGGCPQTLNFTMFVGL